MERDMREECTDIISQDDLQTGPVHAQELCGLGGQFWVLFRTRPGAGSLAGAPTLSARPCPVSCFTG